MSEVAAVRFQSGGTLREGALYVERPADSELPEALLRGEFCYVLAPRQIGKSSLRVRTEKRLRAAGVGCVPIDLSRIGTVGVTPDQWYFALIEEVATGLGLRNDPAGFWATHDALPPVHRWSLYLRDEVLGRTAEPVVIFVDEIDAVITLPFSADDFFAAIRAVYNSRADDPRYARLTFCLIGVAAPGELTRDAARTPFNIGRWVRLGDFTRGQVEAFLPGLASAGGDSHVLLDEIFAWTEGHPFMTQRVCEMLERQGSPGDWLPARRVAAVVEEVFLRGGRAEVPLFADAERRLLSHAYAAQLLQLYRYLLDERSVPADTDNPIHLALRLTGMAANRREESGLWLRVRNRVFATVFDRNWVKEEESSRLLAEPVARWIESDRHDDYVLRGQQLEAARLWAEGRDDLTSEEQEFLRAGLAAARHEQEQRVRRQRLAIANLVLLAAALSIAVVTATSGYVKARRATASESRAKRQAIANAVRAGAAEKLAKGAAAQEAVARQWADENATKARVAEQQARAAAARASAAAFRERREAEREKQARASAESAETRLASLNTTLFNANVRERGIRANALALQTGRAFDALRLAYSAVEASRRRGVAPQSEAVEGLTAALTEARRSQPLGGPQASFESTFLSPGGASILTSSRDGAVRLWNASTGRPIATLQGHPGRITSAAFSLDGRLVFTGGRGGAAHLWDGRTGERRATLRGHRGAVTAASFSPDRKRIVTASDDGIARLWRVSDGHPLALLRGHAGGIYSALFSPDGTRVATAGRDPTPRLWDANTGKLHATLVGHSGAVHSAVFSPSGDRVLTASDDGTARIWDASTGQSLLALKGHSNAVRSAVFSPEGARIVTAGADHEVRLWRDSGELLYTLLGHTDEVNSAEFSPIDGAKIVTGSKDHTARLWDGQTGQPVSALKAHTGDVSAAVFAGDSTHLVTACGDGTARRWNLYGDLSIVTFGGGPAVLSSVFSRGNRRVVGVDATGTVLSWDSQSAQPVGHQDLDTGTLRYAGFSRDGSKLITISGENLATPGAIFPAGHIATPFSNSSDGGYRGRCWDLSQGAARQLARFEGVRWAALSPDGSRILTLGQNGGMVLRDSRAGRVLGEIHARGVSTPSTAFWLDDNRVLTGHVNGTAQVWDTRTGRSFAVLRGRQDGVTCAALSPDGGLIVTGSRDGTARIWRARTGEYVESLVGHGHTVNTAMFSPDGTQVVTASDDGTARLWDIPSGKVLVNYLGHADVVRSAAFSQDGTRITTASADGTVKEFPARLEAFLRMAHGVLGCVR